MKYNSDGGFDNTTHPLINIHEPPYSLVELRKELAFHPDICSVAQYSNTFEECLAVIAMKLDIALDGLYDVEPLCKMLVQALKRRREHPDSPHLRAEGLVDVELIERGDRVEISRRDRNVKTSLPKDAVVTRSIYSDIFKNEGTPIRDTDPTDPKSDPKSE